MRVQHVSAAVGVWLASALLPGTAAASCQEFPPLEQHLAQAEVVFVGTVSGITDERRTALVEVEEVWSGPELPARVTVHGGFEDLGFTTADRYFDEGVRYLFAPSLNAGRLEDNSCTATREWTDDLVALRPSVVATPVPAESDAGPGIGLPGLAVGLAILAVGALSIVAFRRR
jgi:hypothetical protein